MPARATVSGILGHDLRAAIVRRAVTSAVTLGPATVSRRQRSLLRTRQRELLQRHDRIDTSLAHQDPVMLTVAAAERAAGKRHAWRRGLACLVAEMRATTVLELGTNLGVTTAWLTSALDPTGPGHVHTIEGACDVAAIARETLDVAGVADRATVHVGRFKDVLPTLLPGLGQLDLAFVDGHHDGPATVDYLGRLRPALHSRSLVVFDDIRWSPDMTRAWREIIARADTGLAVDLGPLGVWGPRGQDG